ncbi:hypothetical protein DEH18_16980 [Streptomyces sp. NHF165]|uniref:hypothetical protein n=1 Tax=Streptomyces sp. NHF165 TaxID=2175864 RepID=UPI00132F0762|nr:hypothetical protein [Streptomyces sp. NHF165]QHF95273.1 hypothetical protein DEH18_16980 [Streptomyces sp. NHF165]
MPWWLKARRVPALLLPSYLVFLLLVLTFQDLVADVPAVLTGSENPVVAMLLAPVPLYAALLVCLETKLSAAEDTATRNVRMLDAVLALGTVAVAACTGLLIGTLADSPTAVTVGRNTAFLVGLMLCARPLAGAAAVMVPAAWQLAVMLFGFQQGHPSSWSVLPRAAGDPLALAASLAALIAGVGLHLVTRPPHSS